MDGRPRAGGCFLQPHHRPDANRHRYCTRGTCGKGSTTCEQAQNIGKARSAGLELSLQQSLGSHWALGGAYTYLARRNLSDASVRLTDTPRHRLYAAVSWMPTSAS